MFRDVPACSGMFHVPGFIDARSMMPLEGWKLLFEKSLDWRRNKQKTSGLVRIYSETPLYGHLENKATFFGTLAKTAMHFLVEKNPR